MDDLPCVGCGYNLRGTPLSGRCPECGACSRWSASGGELAYRDPQWLGRVHRGLDCVARTYPWMWNPLVWPVFLFGFWAVTTPAPDDKGIARRLQRYVWCGLLILLVPAYSGTIAISRGAFGPGVAEAVEGSGALIAIAALLLATVSVVRAVTRREDARALARRSRHALGASAATTLVAAAGLASELAGWVFVLSPLAAILAVLLCLYASFATWRVLVLARAHLLSASFLAQGLRNERGVWQRPAPGSAFQARASVAAAGVQPGAVKAGSSTPPDE